MEQESEATIGQPQAETVSGGRETPTATPQETTAPPDETMAPPEETMAPPGVSMASPSSSGDAPTVDTPPDAFGDVFSATRHSAPRMPERVGRYHLIKLLGEGGMGAVYKAEQREPIKRLVALKLVRAGHESQAILKRFDSERQALARMDHPSVAKVLDAGADDNGLPFFVMEFVPGEPITEFADKRKLSIRARLELFIQVCEGMSHAHSKALLHRDIKAQNVLAYEKEGKYAVKVIDFGIAKAVGEEKLTNATLTAGFGSVLGTPQTMSPEQAEGSIDLDTRTDVFALGVLLYELIGGRLPLGREELQNKTIHQVLEMVRLKEAPNLSTWLARDPAKAEEIAKARDTRPAALIRQLKRELECIPLKAMRKDRDRRYQSVQKLSEDIQNYLQGRPITAGPESKLYVARKFVGRNKLRLALTALVIAAFLGGGVFYVVKIQRERDFARLAVQHSSAMLVFCETIIEMSSPQSGRDSLTVREAVNYSTLNFTASKFFTLLVPEVKDALYVKLGALARDCGNYDASETNLSLALADCGKVYAADSTEAGGAYLEYATLKRLKGQWQDAEKYGLKAVGVFSNKRTSNLMLHAIALNNLGRCSMDEGSYDKAVDRLKQSITLLDRVDPNVSERGMSALEEKATVLVNLGGVADMQRDHATALKYFKESFDLSKRIFATDDIRYAQSEMNLANAYLASDNPDPALPMLTEALHTYEDRGGADWVETIKCREDYCVALRNAHRLEDAEREYRTCLRDIVKLRNHPEFDRDKAAVNTGLGKTLLKMPGREADAEIPLMEALEYRTKNKDLNLDSTRAALRDLQMIYQKNNHPDKAKYIDDVLSGVVKINLVSFEPATLPISSH